MGVCHRGDRLSLEYVARKQSCDTAQLFGLSDRGAVEVGKRADVNIIDMDAITLHPPRMAYDLPAGGKRLTQRASDYYATIVNGVVTRRDGVDTGAGPGRLVRGVRWLRAWSTSTCAALRAYVHVREHVKSALAQSIRRGDDPAVVAQVGLKAATSRAPKLRCPAGPLARRLSLLKRIAPAGLPDNGIRKANKLGSVPTSHQVAQSI